MTVYLTANDNRSGQKVRLLTNTQSDSVEVSFDPLVIPTGAAFDYIVETVADLPAPVAGYHQLTTGSWAIKNALNLGTNALRVQNGETVYLQGMGWDKLITTSHNNGILVAGNLLCKGLALTTTGTTAVSVGASVGGTWQQFDDCNFAAGSTGFTIGGGSTENVRLNNTRMTATSEGLYISANTVVKVYVHGCYAAANYGCRIPGNCGYLSISQSLFTGTSRGIYYTAGGGGGNMAAASFTNNQFSGASGGAIDWPSADLPGQGLLVVGNALNGVSAYAGHTPASARANYKANCRAGTTLLTETAIVP